MHLVDCILEGKEPMATAEHARHAIKIIEKGYMSPPAQTRCWSLPRPSEAQRVLSNE